MKPKSRQVLAVVKVADKSADNHHQRGKDNERKEPRLRPRRVTGHENQLEHKKRAAPQARARF